MNALQATNNIMDMLRSTINRLVVYGEAPAGTHAEHRLAEEIKSIFEEKLDLTARLIGVPVVVWGDEGSSVYGCGFELQAVAWPAYPGGVVEGEAVVVQGLNELRERDVAERIVVSKAPLDPDEAVAFYRVARARGAIGLVFYDEFPGRFRRIVVVDAPFTLSSTGLAGIPVVHIRREDSQKIVECRRLKLVHGGRLESGYGYTVEAILELGSGDYEVIVSAHHDHWLSGANDNLAGVAAILAVARLLSSRRGAGRIRLVSFTAEEFGDPGLPGWYWAYGSRKYVEMLEAMGILDNVVAVLNFDIAGASSVSLYSTGMLKRILAHLADKIGFKFSSLEPDTTDSDSYSFSSLGIEAATVMGYDTWLEFYHTDVDTPEKLDYNKLATLVKLYTEAAIELLERGWKAFSYSEYAKELYIYLRDFPPLTASLYRLQRATPIAEAHGLHHILAKSYRRLNRVLPTVIYSERRSGAVELESYIALPLLYLSDLRTIREAENRAKGGNCQEAITILKKLDVFRVTSRGRLLPSPGEGLNFAGCDNLGHVLDVLERVTRHRLWESSIAAARSIDEVYESIVRSIPTND